ncbi:MAG TPA: maleylpyruvate isomerase family mycothiol-dependent enzyme [Jatrophihabitans sp.]|jgi:maleylpyruvate isomerase|uniref:maleylpyruvate isomerase family mycothiol-dependent enzyme n=1 Tax=Jatrophihabitans sp. TaxID=1932789 RepID=UPI002DFD891F|nr:maleylpyruvate isomerase family mycothiol-dependent enzyme [Jatrophihabitans sp.]
MSEPNALLPALRASTADLALALDDSQWSDADVAAPSLCEGWTRGHVLTHLARNADGIAGTLAGALRGEIVARYPDGWEARNAAIDAGAGRSFAELRADVVESAERLDRVLGAIADADAWDRPTDQDRPAVEWLMGRWREIEIHRVDLAGDYSPDRWPPLLVTLLLPQVAETLADRVPSAVTVEVSAEGSLSGELVGSTWSAGSGPATVVSGPDWALLAWLVGRPEVVQHLLGSLPELAPLR